MSFSFRIDIISSCFSVWRGLWQWQKIITYGKNLLIGRLYKIRLEDSLYLLTFSIIILVIFLKYKTIKFYDGVTVFAFFALFLITHCYVIKGSKNDNVKTYSLKLTHI